MDTAMTTPNRQPIRVLLLDDDADDHLLTRELLTEITGQRFQLDWESHYTEAQAAIAARQHDIYLVDYHLGPHNGLDLIREAVTNGHRAPFILLTGHAAREVDEQAMQAGAADYLSKREIDAVLLERTIRHALDRARAMQEMARLVAIIEQTADTIIVTDIAGRIQYVNPVFEEVTGYRRDEVYGQNPRLLKSGQTNPEVHRQMWAAVTSGRSWAGHYTNRKKDGSHYEVRATISPIRDAAGQVVSYVGVLRDVSYERQIETQLRQSQKTEAVGRLAGGIAHDFNNLLTVITGYTSLVLRADGLTDQVRDRIEGIQKAADRAAELTRQLLAYSRRQKLHFKVVALNDVVAAMQPMLRRVISEDIELRTICEPGTGPVRADVAQLEQVVLNLVINARDAMPRGGQIVIETSDYFVDESLAARDGELKPGRYSRLAVSDTGVGMTAEVRAHLFEPFFTTKGPGKGTGLGLATCHGIITQSGGYIRAYSEVGQGTVFKIYLPVADEPIETAVPPPDAAGGLKGTETVLLVEDELEVRELAAFVLREAGYRVLEAGHGREALALLEAEPHHKIQLVISDLVMPQMNGQEMMYQLRQLRPELPALFISGYTHDVLTQRSLINTTDGFLEKPFTPTQLLWKVRQTLQSASRPVADPAALVGTLNG
jgi:PAS domain S-box-containing protein